MEEVFGFFSDDPVAIEKHLASGKALCMVLNRDVPPQAIAQGTKEGYIFCVDFNGEERFAVANGCYKQKQKRFDRPNPIAVKKCSAMGKFMDGIYPTRIFTGRLEDPLCLLLHEQLAQEQITILARGYEILETVHEGKQCSAIACVYYNPNYETEGRVLAQWYN